ncbi:hypothetical protein THIOM_002793 [Candidatus Thiomargarita nelsonii]|uniref:Secreted protein n=1 Tax=Candidatus Thiomargarita nelsonii TaxID=1003181 RepID=A0A0A6NYK4_9GAMM|nr:hypothetical protein THIOM_002793 [Candidatus Thiomargarita nelsonii]
MKKLASYLTVFLIAYPIQAYLDESAISPEMLEAIKKNYCTQVEKDNLFIQKMNELAKENAERLKKGSYAVYELHHIAQDNETVFTEKWEVISLAQKRATVKITNSITGSFYQEMELSDKIYGGIVSRDKPSSCLFWRFFAVRFGQGEPVTIQGKKIQTLYRHQELIGNVLPEFTYGKVPFNIVIYRETITYKDYNVIKNKKLIEFEF